ncbi:VapC toxin family PIN domain ribonuclease [Burkholderia multivorans]|uniref:VapC toxin family PIN domain ribonuclease n=1 Tax=Burkholderia multivorans TaxID=87883 RepID=UPI002018FCDB|nr:VapC toxin family PIN domain ribonuclease [Burkholderia multivorans]MCO1370435.1 VapC toxin family PIN domain ribonuclease [Burkholderia multivorans]MCO1459733.1 VapC toxin family PIN domain ribonuclease [Burkholderia multivorans]MCO1467300.1 VapC toxin family PIN domain ribonuclease [Burkholderia multivorans]UQO20957.1 VapC toxin family PIN domain ribonuclease [Burkholderia multivorans]UQO84126.1 VapC toxin family PIN domain ribonuclease [Burkholderia multivorans]
MYPVVGNASARFESALGATRASWLFRKALRDDVGLCLAIVTAGERRRGVEIIRHRGGMPQAARVENSLDRVSRELGRNNLPLDGEVGQLCGRLRMARMEDALAWLIAALSS